MTDSTLTDFATYIRSHLNNRGWEVSDLAAESGLSQSVIFRWIRGSNRPNLDNARTVARILDVPLLEMLVVAGLLSPEEARANVSVPASAADLDDDELISELRHRLQRTDEDA